MERKHEKQEYQDVTDIDKELEELLDSSLKSEGMSNESDEANESKKKNKRKSEDDKSSEEENEIKKNKNLGKTLEVAEYQEVSQAALAGRKRYLSNIFDIKQYRQSKGIYDIRYSNNRRGIIKLTELSKALYTCIHWAQNLDWLGGEGLDQTKSFLFDTDIESRGEHFKEMSDYFDKIFKDENGILYKENKIDIIDVVKFRDMCEKDIRFSILFSGIAPLYEALSYAKVDKKGWLSANLIMENVNESGGVPVKVLKKLKKFVKPKDMKFESKRLAHNKTLYMFSFKEEIKILEKLQKQLFLKPYIKELQSALNAQEIKESKQSGEKKSDDKKEECITSLSLESQQQSPPRVDSEQSQVSFDTMLPSQFASSQKFFSRIQNELSLPFSFLSQNSAPTTDDFMGEDLAVMYDEVSNSL